MAASIVWWTAPKLTTDLWRHLTDLMQVWRTIVDETVIVKEGSNAFGCIMMVMNECDVGQTINPVCMTRVGRYTSYDLTVGSWKVFLELKNKRGQAYCTADFVRVNVTPPRHPPLCTTRTYVCVQFTGPDAEWEKNRPASTENSQRGS